MIRFDDVSDAMTPTACAAHCTQLQYVFMGLARGKRCKCGMEYGRFGRRPDSDCNMACEGDATVMCGASSINSVYRVYEDDKFSEMKFRNSEIQAGQQLGRIVMATTTEAASVIACGVSCLMSPSCFGFVWIQEGTQSCEIMSATGNLGNYTIPAGGKYYSG
ncbi:PREDICTED: uncharacterized protein LOC106814696 [Priapulus caudatus]|uniref:Uncharacterized protein LOC106814696 n=1 Tax=Priapulus caudatus TaxID=37621 RepID=A0ABM1EQQ6_PRICU|nr:PREDICTED: uncharacterized protein LOC106814696 [Priapulus caudatus]